MCKLFVRHCPLHVHKDTTHPQQRHYKLGVNRQSSYCPRHSRLEKPAVLPATRFLRSGLFNLQVTKSQDLCGFSDKTTLLSHRVKRHNPCLLYTSDAADDLLCVDLGGRRIIKKKKKKKIYDTT